MNCSDRFRDAAGDQVAQHGVQPTHDLGMGPAQVAMALEHTFSTAA